MVRVRGASVQDVRVGDELDIADVEDHVQGQTLGGFFQNAEGFLLAVGEGGDDALVGEAREGADVVGVPSIIVN